MSNDITRSSARSRAIQDESSAPPAARTRRAAPETGPRSRAWTRPPPDVMRSNGTSCRARSARHGHSR
jgi:hypothetical protein